MSPAPTPTPSASTPPREISTSPPTSAPAPARLTKQGANALTLSGNNTFDKLITVSEGTLKAGSATAFNDTGTLAVLPGTTFDLNGYDAKFISMTSNTGTITTTGAGSGIDTLTISASNVDNGIGNLFTDNGTRQLKLDFTSAASPAAARQATTNVNNTYSGGLILGNAMRALQSRPAPSARPEHITNGPFGRGTDHHQRRRDPMPPEPRSGSAPPTAPSSTT